jgi:hypothetical protein
MSLMRLSVKKAAHADVSRAAYRKSGGKPHEVHQRNKLHRKSRGIAGYAVPFTIIFLSGNEM